MRKSIAACILAAMLCAAVVTLSAGTSDPLVTVSYVRKIYNQTVEANAQARAAGLSESNSEKLSAAVDACLLRAVAQRAAAAVLRDMPLSARSWTRVELSQGDVVSGPVGAGFMLESGTALASGTAELIDVTAGRTLAVGAAAAANTYYMASQAQQSGLRVTSASAVVRLKDGAGVTRAAQSLYEDEADRLNSVGLLRGSNYGYELNRRPTRQESLIMLIRLLGEENAALAYTGGSTFTDLTGWPDGIRYVCYAQNKGYTNGMTPTQFSQQTPADANMYCTYVLRALGYSDAQGDFTYRAAVDKAIELGLLTAAQYEQLKTTGLLRDHMALISYNALWAPCKGTGQTLGQRLVSAGVLTAQQLSSIKK